MVERNVGECEPRIRAELALIDLRDGEIGAWQFIDRDRAMARARQLDQSAIRGPLHGISVGIKDIIDVANMPTECGTPIYAGNIAKRDAACVELVKAAGAIIIGKTATTELAANHPAKTRNPLNSEHTPGGSSSGSAAAVAAGMVRLAFGTQTAGSLLRPASYCGVVGFKPTFGLVSRAGVKVQSESLDTVGVFTRTVEDAALWYQATISAGKVPRNAAVDGPLRVLIVSNLMDQAEPEMVNAVERAATALAATGIATETTRLSAIFDQAQIDQRIVQLAEMARFYAVEHRQHRHHLSVELTSALDEGAAIPADVYQSALARIAATRTFVAESFADADVWLMPSATGAAPKGLASTGDAVFNRLASALHLPAINLPVYRNSMRMPLGLQLIAPQFHDEKLLVIAKRVIGVLQGGAHE